MVRNAIRSTAVVCRNCILSGCRHKKYEIPITKDTLQPDKVLFDRAIKISSTATIEVARLTLNTLINTYDTSEYLAKAKLAIADSWFREGGAHGLAQAEAEYKDFILFYPQHGRSRPSRSRRSARSTTSRWRSRIAIRRRRSARKTECRRCLMQFPNCKFVPRPSRCCETCRKCWPTRNSWRADSITSRAVFQRGQPPRVVDQYPLFSSADEALWELADSYPIAWATVSRIRGRALTRAS